MYGSAVLVGASAHEHNNQTNKGTQENKSKMRLYHYTSETGHKGIKDGEVIFQSDNFVSDCKYGKGVYLTSMNPQKTKKDIAMNNYDGAWKNRLADVDFYIEIEIPDGDINLKKVAFLCLPKWNFLNYGYNTIFME